MRVREVLLHVIRIPMREPFAASHGVEYDKHCILVEVRSHSGAVGFAECVAGDVPHYTEETTVSAYQVLKRWLIPSVLGLEFQCTDDISIWYRQIGYIRGNRMAKAGLEMALWDLFAAESQTPLSSLIGTTKTEVGVGISVGLQRSEETLIEKVSAYAAQGFQRAKLKIEPGKDESWVRAVRDALPDFPLMVDANSAYAGLDFDALRWLDDYDLTMVEQPLAHDDMVDHATLQRHLRTSICLDESIRSADDLRRAAALGACRIVNVKAGRIGGFTEVRDLHAASVQTGVELWCGGMLETGIGRIHNIALSAMPNFTWPGDTAPSGRYFEEDVIDPPVTFSRPGWLPVEPLCGVASRVVRSRVERWTVETDRQSN